MTNSYALRQCTQCGQLLSFDEWFSGDCHGDMPDATLGHKIAGTILATWYPLLDQLMELTSDCGDGEEDDGYHE